MSDRSKMFLVMMLAASLVIASGAVFYLGGENEAAEPSLPEDTYMMLTYEVEGTRDGVPVNGSFGVELLTRDSGGFVSYTWPFNVTGNLGYLTTMPSSIFGTDFFLVRSTMDTVWGEKQGLLYIGHNFNWNQSMGVVFAYRGAHTDLAYRMDLVAPGVKVTYSLANVNITGMETLDLVPREDVSDLMQNRQIENGYSNDLGGGGTWGLLESRGSTSYRMCMNATNYTFMVFGEQDILSMASGGDFSYVEEWSILGNGSTEFVLGGQMVFYYADPNYCGEAQGLLEVQAV